MPRHRLPSAVLLLLCVLICGSSGAAHTHLVGRQWAISSPGSNNLQPSSVSPSDFPIPTVEYMFRGPHLVDLDGVLLALFGALFDAPVRGGEASARLAARISTDNGVTWSPYLSPPASGVFPVSHYYPFTTELPRNINPFCVFVEGYEMRRQPGIPRHQGGYAHYWESSIHFLGASVWQGGDLLVDTASVRVPLLEPRSSNDLVGFLHNFSAPITRMRDGALVFPVQLLTWGGAAVSTVMYFSDQEKNWRLARSGTHAGCTSTGLLEWEEGKLLMMTSCLDGRRKVYETSDKGDTWAEALGTLSRVWGNSLDAHCNRLPGWLHHCDD
ncbi:trans-sialidase [Trypanosoma conorhini]|uniref:Trans-sialidase n=1 Tax=Trypanosoma conorhini TaxID=83891 RepID=A0A3R7M6F8_9TRYP|nr:trans-sialidase [Trypanosoma conorhini]RNF27461.1 trans-sialidase [Trypanosoma conorhini]